MGLDPKHIQKLDQMCAELREVLPSSCWAIYQGAVTQGFSEEQAFALTKIWFTETNRAMMQ